MRLLFYIHQVLTSQVNSQFRHGLNQQEHNITMQSSINMNTILQEAKDLLYTLTVVS